MYQCRQLYCKAPSTARGRCCDSRQYRHSHPSDHSLPTQSAAKLHRAVLSTVLTARAQQAAKTFVPTVSALVVLTDCTRNDFARVCLQIPVELWDQRTILDHGVPVENSARGPYNVSVILKGVGIAEMNAGPQPVIGVSDVLDKPGKVVIEIPCPKTRTTAAVSLDMTTKHGLHYQDEFVLSFHMHFHKLLKWLIALPLLAMSVVAVIFAQTMGFDSGRTYHLG